MNLRRLFGSGIWRRTFLFIAAGMLVTTLVFFFLFYGYFRSVLESRISEEERFAVNETSEDLDTILTNVRQIAYYLCIDGNLSSQLVNENDAAPLIRRYSIARTISLDTGALTSPLMRSAHAMFFVDPQFDLAQQLKGFFSFERDYTRDRVYSVLDVRGEPWYSQTVKRNGQIYAFHAASYHPLACFAHQVRSTRVADPRFGENVGVMVYAMPESQLMGILRSACITDNAVALLLFEDEVFLSTDSSVLSPGSPAKELAARPVGGTVSRYTLNQEVYMSSIVSFQGDWRCVLLIPQEDIYAYVRPTLSMLAFVAALFLVLSALIAFWIADKLTQPIVNLSNVMAHMDSRYLPQPVVPPVTQDEIALLYGSYNMMTVRISDLLQREAQEAEKLHRAELQAMQAQINPHFIYNTLDSISCSALMTGNDDIATLVDSLVNILKYSVNFSRTTVPLREELEHLKHYVRIQKLRLGDSFLFDCDVPEAYLDVSVYPILLQPLVENALFHAQSGGEQLHVRLFCRQDGDMLEIHVQDNGRNGDPDALNALLAANPEEAGGENGHGIGIRNVNRRVQLLLGKNCGLHYASAPEGGLDAVVRVPLG